MIRKGFELKVGLSLEGESPLITRLHHVGRVELVMQP
jgi:hypothetical protein